MKLAREEVAHAALVLGRALRGRPLQRYLLAADGVDDGIDLSHAAAPEIGELVIALSDEFRAGTSRRQRT
jgi:hypothetical protein